MDHACEGIARRRTITPLTDRRVFGEVAERSIAADCKSAAHVATEVRTLPSPPTSQAPWPERGCSVGGAICLAASALRARRGDAPLNLMVGRVGVE